MAFAKNIMLGGLSGPTADAINGQVSANVTATPVGTQATSLVVSTDFVFVTSPSGSGAVRLFAGQGGDSCVISNAGSSAMFVWPPSGVAFLGTATNNAVSVAPNISCKFTCINATTWINEPATAGGLN